MPSSSKQTTHSKSRLTEKTVQELRVLAKSLGLTKYSKLAKAQLLQLITAASTPAMRQAAAPPKATKKTPKGKKPASRRVANEAPASRAKPPAHKPRPATRPAPHTAATSAADQAVAAATPADRKGDKTFVSPKISPLPPLTTPMLTLRGQKPGVLHAAWCIDPSRSMPLSYLRLRILGMEANNAGVIDEIPLPALQGGQFIHLAEDSVGPLCAEIGYHSSDGRFIVMLRHAGIRLPQRPAAGRGDPQWFISEEDFREMYVRSGGALEGTALVWHTSFSSR
jgi:hypothetical protein